jgi:cell division septation protein DedD
MIAPSESNTNSHGTERRSCARQRVLFSSVVLSEGNCGRVLNISPQGLALQTDTELVGEEFPFRFKFSPSLAWVEAKGRVAWRNNLRNVVGIEFVGLTDEVQRQIQTWMDWKRESSEPYKSDVPIARAPLNAGAGTGGPIAVSGHFVDSESDPEFMAVAPVIAEDLNTNVDEKQVIQTPEFLFPPTTSLGVNAEHQKASETPVPEFTSPTPESAHASVEDLPSAMTAVSDPTETQDLLRAGEVRIAHGIGAPRKLIGLALVIILMFSVVFFARKHSQVPSKNLQIGEAIRAPHPSAPAVQATLPTTSPPATSPGAISPEVGPAVPHIRSSDQKRVSHGPAFVLQVAAMLHEENANALASTLRDSNFPAFVMKLPTERFNHVLVGPFNSASSAMEAQNQLEQKGYKPIRTQWKLSSR